jgi:hypothetical protein
VDIPGQELASPFKDGGVVDRIGLKAWRDRRRAQLHAAAPPAAPPPAICHIISKSSPFSGFDDALATGEHEIYLVHSPKSGVNFFDLGDFETHMLAAYERARPVTEQVKRSRRAAGLPGKHFAY